MFFEIPPCKLRAGAFCACLAIGFLSAAPAGADAHRIGSRQEIVRTVLEGDADSGHLFAVLRYDDGIDHCFSVNISYDGGESWIETFERRSAIELRDFIGATIVDGNLYVSFIGRAAVNSAKLMRFRTSDGAQDPIYGSHTVFNAAVGDEIVDIKVASNGDWFDDHLYLFTISEEELRFFWSDEDGGAGSEPWHEVPTGVTNAWFALDVTANENAHLGSGFNPMVVFMGSGWELFFWRFDGVVGYQIELDDPIYSVQVSVSAFEDRVVLSYWTQLYQFKTCVSPNSGTQWSCEVVQGTGYGYPVDVTARHDGGFAMIFARDNGPCEYRRRGYSGAWSDPELCGAVDADSDARFTFDRLPPYGVFDLGGILISSDEVSGGAYFFRAPEVFSDGFEAGDLSGWSLAVS